MLEPIAGVKRAGDLDMSNIKVNVKWGKEAFSDVEVDLSQPPLVFKAQLFALSGVPPDRQKVMVKGGLLKDDDWGKQIPKEGSSVMMMGSVEAVSVEAPKVALTFLEDLPESEQATQATKAYGSGLTNLGNTCYMNSTIQCLYAVEPLKQAIVKCSAPIADPSSKLVAATRGLFNDLQRGGEAFPPFNFLSALRAQYPQFSQTTSTGVPMQQDAEECFSSLMYSLKDKLRDESGQSVVDSTFGIGMQMKLKSEESGEEIQEKLTSYLLKVNITQEVNHLHEGIALGLKDDREKNSEALGHTVVFKGSSVITHLPPCLTVQMMRFFYRADSNQKAKILRKVGYTLELDVYDFCSDELKKALDGPRDAYKVYQDRKIEAEKKVKNEKARALAAGGIDKVTDKGPVANSKGAAVQAASTSTADAEMIDATGPSTSVPHTSYVGAQTGKYELFALLTHKGRSADSGHYVSWVKQKDNTWALFDDDQIISKTNAEVLDLAGGGDWHMAYLLLYRQCVVPSE